VQIKELKMKGKIKDKKFQMKLLYKELEASLVIISITTESYHE
jgi:hypothetical protein